jgi:hypothetical protein
MHVIKYISDGIRLREALEYKLLLIPLKYLFVAHAELLVNL